jgi:hypothetical protein
VDTRKVRVVQNNWRLVAASVNMGLDKSIKAMEKVMNMDVEAEFKAHFNEPVLIMDRLGRVIGYGEDEQDCYMIVMYMGGKIVWNTAVGGYVFLDRLKGQEYVKATNGEEWDDFVRLNNILELNGAPKQKEWRKELYSKSKGNVNDV